MKLESELKKQFCEELKTFNAIVLQLPASFRSEIGTPDSYVSHSLWCGFVEFKRADIGKIAPKQQYYLRELGSRNPLSAVVVWLPTHAFELHTLEFFDIRSGTNTRWNFTGDGCRAFHFLNMAAAARRDFSYYLNDLGRA